MLSRVADSLYWMSRYLERVEHTARLLDVTLNQMLEQFPDPTGRRLGRMYSCLGVTPPAAGLNDARAAALYMTSDLSNPSSIAASVAAGRENARQVREQISSEMWEQINQFYLQVRQVDMDNLWQAQQSYSFLRTVKEGVHLFQGITDSTMTHGEGWDFIQLGRFLERASSTALLLDGNSHVFTAIEEHAADSAASDYLEWVGVLKSCSAFEAYCKAYTADVRPERIAEFLLLNPDFPRSVCFAAGMVETSLRAIAEAQQTHIARHLERLAGRLHSALRFVQVEEIMTGSLHSYLVDIRNQCSQIHTAIHQVYIDYPIETAFAP